MKFKNLLALLLVLCMIVTVFAACSNEEPAPDAGNQGGNQGGNAGGGDEGGDEGDEDEIVTVRFWWQDNGNIGSSSGTPAVEEAVNAITEAEIGVHVEFVWVASTDYATQISLAIANNEVVDVLTCTPQAAGSFLTFYSNGILGDMTPYIDEYAAETKALFGPELLNATTIDGKLYGLSTYRILNSNFYIAFRKDVLEHIGMYDAAQNMTGWADYEAIMQAIIDSDLNMYGTGHGDKTLFGDRGTFFCGEKFTDCYTYDIIGDSLGMIWTDQKGNVEVAMDRPEAEEMCAMAARWMDAGYVYPDTAYSQDGTEVLCGQGVYGSFVIQSEFGVDVNKSQTVGKEMTCPQIVPGMLSTTLCQKFSLALGSTSAEPEAAMKFVNMIYTDARVISLLIYGIEGVNYEMVDGEACYIGDADASTSGYHGMSFSLGNQFLLAPWKGEGKDFRVGAMENFQNCTKSAYLGLSVSVTDKDDLVAAIYAVSEEYWPQVSSGYYTPALMAEFREKLDAAGIDDYVALYQNAVTEFLAA